MRGADMTPNEEGRNPTATPNGGDFVSASDYTLEELRAAVFGEIDREKGDEDGQPGREGESSPVLDPLVAISLLSRKEYDGKRDDLRGVLFDEARDPRLRHNAAQALGRAFGSDAEPDLLEALDIAQEPEVRRGLLGALETVGSERTLEAIGQRRPEFAESLERQAAWTETLIAFRTRTDATSDLGRLPEPDLVSIKGDTFDITLRDADDEVREAALGSLRKAPDQHPIDVSADATFELDCLNQRLLLAFDETFLANVDGPLTSKHVAAILLEHDDVESGEWLLRYYLLVQPDAPEGGQGEARGERVGRTGQVFGTTTGGQIHYGGRFRVENGEIAFEIRSIERPGLRPVRIDGRLEDGQLIFEEAVTSDTAPDAQQASPAAPDEPSSLE